MDLCLYTNSLGDLPFEDALDVAARIGCGSIEIAGGGQSRAPHLRLGELLGDRRKRIAFADAFATRGLRIAALNCSAWPLHPVHGEAQAQIIRDTIRLAGELGVETVVSMSGTPGDGPGSTTVNWGFYPWPADAVALMNRQWEIAIPFWQEMGAYAEANGVRHIAFELHPLHLVFNVPTLLRMREAVGPVIGTNMDPSHLFWQQMDPLAAIAALGPAVAHVHLKDTGAAGRAPGARRRPGHGELRGPEPAGLGLPHGRPRPRPGLVGVVHRSVAGGGLRRRPVHRERGSVPLAARGRGRGGGLHPAPARVGSAGPGRPRGIGQCNRCNSWYARASPAWR